MGEGVNQQQPFLPHPQLGPEGTGEDELPPPEKTPAAPMRRETSEEVQEGQVVRRPAAYSATVALTSNMTEQALQRYS
jgi:hypothetical protein